jgi:hypothetical protein
MADKIKTSTNLIEFLQSNRVKLQNLPDGSYKIKDIVNNNCHPLNSDVLRMLASYCYQKGGTFRTADGRDFKDFMAKVLTTDPPPNVGVVNYWLREITKTTYYCDGPEKFMVRTTAERSVSDIQSFIIPYVHYVKLGLDEGLKAQTQTSVRDLQTFLHFGFGRLTNPYTRKKHLVNHLLWLTNSYAKSTNLVNRVEEPLDEELFRIAFR